MSKFARFSWLLILLAPDAVLGQAIAPTVSSSRPFAFTHVTVIDMTGASPQPDMTVVVSGTRIAAIAKSATLRLPPVATVIDATGKYLIPGLWDMHVHAAWEANGTFFPLFLANGVTGVRDMFGRLDIIGAARVRMAQGRLTEPRIVGSGPIVDGPDPVWGGSVAVATPGEGRRAVDSLKAAGADFIKVYNRLSREAYLAIAAEARRQGIPFVGHVPNSVMTAEAAEAGQRSIEHLHGVLLGCSSREAEFRAALVEARRSNVPDSVRIRVLPRQVPQILQSYDARRCERLVALFRERGTWHVPTLVVRRSFAWLDDSTLALDPRLR